MEQGQLRLRVHRAPSRPTLIYDDQCRFCARRVERWKRLTGAAVEYIAASKPDAGNRFPEIGSAQLDRSLQFIMTDGYVYEGAHGALRALGVAGRSRWLLRLYERNRLCAALLELGYRWVADHRSWL